MGTIRLETKSIFKNKKLEKFVGINEVDIRKISEASFYKLESFELDTQALKKLVSQKALEVFHDPIVHGIQMEEKENSNKKSPDYVVEVGFRPGVTDNVGNTAGEALLLLDIKCTVSTGNLFFMHTDSDSKKIKKFASENLGNELIQTISIYTHEEFQKIHRFENVKLPHVVLDENPETSEINISISDQKLLDLSHERCLALNIDELRYIRKYYESSEVKDERRKMGLPENPTDVEVEVLAQTWSEHCKHKIFSAEIEYNEGDRNITINSLYKSFIKGLTARVSEEKKIDWLISVFDDNAGIVRFDENIDLCIKVETHNSPSALDPYGGAITGILGVNRDILGCGLGAKPIANMDVFCFSSPDWPDSKNKKHLPVGLKHPRRIFEGVHRGIEDGGNKSGIPTVNGAIYFDRDFAGKPLVFCGTVGFLPALLDDGTPTSQKEPDVGDRIIMIGGAIGADGIHGATMSSLELNEFSPATAVQIGDPLTQKRVLDFITHARDNMLYSSITDNGAGGLSSSVGEMAVKTNGATIDLSRPSVKYPGLSPYELMISESQERMTVAVPENKLCDFMSAAKKFGVVATDIGEFTDSGTLKVLYHNEIVANLNLDFLHESLPQMKLKARWDGPKKRKHWSPAPKREKVPGNLNNAFLDSALKKLLSSPNIASKESWVRRYDHEVQAATHIKPFMGKSGSGPSDSGVIWLYPHGGERNNAISIGCGLNPRLSLHDPYLMAQFAVDEALRNVIATGGDPEFCCLLDNFCWPDPVLSEKNSDGDYKLGQLVKTCQGLYDTCLEYGAPLVSGKDSMKNDFRGKKENGEEVTISVLPTLLVTAMAKTDVTATVTSPFKNEGDHIYLLGEQGAGLVGSEFCEFFEMESCLPTIDPKKNYDIYKTLHKEIGNKRIASCHDISDGGLLPCICESSFGNLLGAEIDLTAIKNGNTVDLLFNETPGRFVITVKPDHTDDFEKCFKNLPFTHIGQVSSDKKIKLTIEDKKEITFNIEDLLQSYGKWSSK